MAVRQEAPLRRGPILRTPEKRVGGARKALVVTTAATGFAITGLLVYEAIQPKQQNPDQTPIPGGIVEPSNSPIPTPFSTENPIVTLPPTPGITPSPTPTPTPEITPFPTPTESIQNMTFREIILNDAEFTRNGEAISFNGRLSYNYSQRVLDSADISKISVNKKALDNVFSITKNTMYKVAGLKAGTDIKLAGKRLVQHELATTPKIEGKVNKINVYVVSENELDQMQTDLKNSKLKYTTFNDWPKLDKLMGIMHFEKDGTLVAILSSQERYVGNSLAGTPEDWNKKNIDYRVTFDGPGSSFFMLTVAAQIGQGKPVDSPLPDSVYKALGCSESNDFCRISGSSKIQVTFQN